jgi:hypothetical protein
MLILSRPLLRSSTTSSSVPRAVAAVRPFITLSEKDVDLFFAASLYLWFWNWVDNNCPKNMAQALCQGCFPYSVTMCVADENTCYATSDGNGPACPYSLCREGIMHYFSYRIK